MLKIRVLATMLLATTAAACEIGALPARPNIDAATALTGAGGNHTGANVDAANVGTGTENGTSTGSAGTTGIGGTPGGAGGSGSTTGIGGTVNTGGAVFAQLRTRTSDTILCATATVLESWRNLRRQQGGLLTDALIAGHRSVCCETRFPRLVSGRRQFSGQVDRRAEVHFVWSLAAECWVGHLGVVLLNEERHECAQPLYRVERVQVQPLMLQGTPKRLDHRVRKGDLDLRKDTVQARGEQGSVHRTVDVFDAGIDVQDRLACADQMLASCEQNLARSRWFKLRRHCPCQDLS